MQSIIACSILGVLDLPLVRYLLTFQTNFFYLPVLDFLLLIY